MVHSEVGPTRPSTSESASMSRGRYREHNLACEGVSEKTEGTGKARGQNERGGERTRGRKEGFRQSNFARLNLPGWRLDPHQARSSHSPDRTLPSSVAEVSIVSRCPEWEEEDKRAEEKKGKERTNELASLSASPSSFDRFILSIVHFESNNELLEEGLRSWGHLEMKCGEVGTRKDAVR